MMEPSNPSRVFLVVIDEAPELKPALHYACLRAKHSGGRVALLYVMEAIQTQHWAGVEDLMREERRGEAEELVAKWSEEAIAWSGGVPVVYLREGETREELLKLIDEEPSISILILGAASGKDGPGPLVTYLATGLSGRLRVPITIVPGALTDEDLAALT